MKKPKNMARGFTLIELLVVIAIIALLTAIIMTNLLGSRSKARDAQRISDLGHIQFALELYYDKCKAYPASPLSSNLNTVCGYGGRLSDYISKIPTPPPNPNNPSINAYDYSPTDYVLHVTLENANDVTKDSVPAGTSGFVCGEPVDYCLGPK